MALVSYQETGERVDRVLEKIKDMTREELIMRLHRMGGAVEVRGVQTPEVLDVFEYWLTEALPDIGIL